MHRKTAARIVNLAIRCDLAARLDPASLVLFRNRPPRSNISIVAPSQSTTLVVVLNCNIALLSAVAAAELDRSFSGLAFIVQAIDSTESAFCIINRDRAPTGFPTGTWIGRRWRRIGGIAGAINWDAPGEGEWGGWHISWGATPFGGRFACTEQKNN